MADSQFYRPGLPQLISMIRSDLLTRFEQDTLLRRMDAEVYARVQAQPYTRCTGISIILPEICYRTCVMKTGCTGTPESNAAREKKRWQPGDLCAGMA